MKKLFLILFVLSANLICQETTANAAAFTAGNIVVCRVGTGAAALTSAATAVFLDEYTIAGTPVQSIALPTAVVGLQRRLTASGTATSECYVNRSIDGQFLIVTGYDADPGTSTIAGTTTAAFNRIIGRVDANGIVDTSTAITDAFNANNIRSATSTNGINLWAVGGNSGVRFTTFGTQGTTTDISTTFTNLRVINVFGGTSSVAGLPQLYASSASGALRLGTIGTGVPTTTGQTITNLPSFPTGTTSPYQYFFADLSGAVAGVDTLYVADDTATTGGITKYSLVGGNWVSNGTVGAVAGYRGLTGRITSPGGVPTVTLFATRDTTFDEINTITDASGYNAAFAGTLNLVVAATTGNIAFRGIAFAPLMPLSSSVLVSGRVTKANGRGLSKVLVTMTGSSGEIRYALSNPQGYFNFADVSAGDTYIFSAESKRYSFAEPTQVLYIKGDMEELSFVAIP